MADSPEGRRGRGRPKASDPTSTLQLTISARVRPAVRHALEKMAKQQRRKPTEMARIIIAERLIAEGLLPEDFDF